MMGSSLGIGYLTMYPWAIIACILHWLHIYVYENTLHINNNNYMCTRMVLNSIE